MGELCITKHSHMLGMWLPSYNWVLSLSKDVTHVF